MLCPTEGWKDYCKMPQAKRSERGGRTSAPAILAQDRTRYKRLMKDSAFPTKNLSSLMLVPRKNLQSSWGEERPLVRLTRKVEGLPSLCPEKGRLKFADRTVRVESFCEKEWCLRMQKSRVVSPYSREQSVSMAFSEGGKRGQSGKGKR